MIIINSKELKKEDGTRIIVQFHVTIERNVIMYRIIDIQYCERRKRTWKRFGATFMGSWDYRRLDQQWRMKYENEKYVAFVGKELLRHAVMSAWESLKPDYDSIFEVMKL